MHGAGLLQGLLHAYILYRYLHAELAYIAKTKLEGIGYISCTFSISCALCSSPKLRI